MSSTAASSHLSSVIALVVGIGLAVGVSAIFGILGWGGELASQTAGAASGAAPLIVDGVRQRRGRTERQEVALAIRGLPSLSNLLIATLFGFALLITDNLLSLVASGLARASIWVSKAPDAGWLNVYLLLGGTIQLPLLLVLTFCFALAAAHRLGDHPRRWLCFGIGVYVVVRVATVVVGRIQVRGAGLLELSIGAAFVAAMLLGVSMLGARRARITQTRFQAARLFRRLPAEDQHAVLGLIGETADDRLEERSGQAAAGQGDPPPR